MSNTDSKKPAQSQAQAPQRKPNERGTVDVQAHVRIFDPKTKQVFVEGRA